MKYFIVFMMLSASSIIVYDSLNQEPPVRTDKRLDCHKVYNGEFTHNTCNWVDW